MKETLTRVCPKYLLKHYSRRGADDFLADFKPGTEMMGMTNGQFSLADLLESLVDWCGGSVRSIDIATWTASGYDAARMLQLTDSGKCGRMRWVVDDIFTRRQPQLSRALLTAGSEIRILKTHAKFAVLRGNRDVVLRTSMNLNANPRLEFFEVSDSPELVGFFSGLVDKVYANDENRRVRLADIPDEEDSWLTGLDLE
jgi:hypothetical protein